MDVSNRYRCIDIQTVIWTLNTDPNVYLNPKENGRPKFCNSLAKWYLQIWEYCRCKFWLSEIKSDVNKFCYKVSNVSEQNQVSQMHVSEEMRSLVTSVNGLLESESSNASHDLYNLPNTALCLQPAINLFIAHCSRTQMGYSN